MHAINKTLGIIIAGAATLALISAISLPDQKPSYQVFNTKAKPYLSTSLSASDDDQYEVHVRSSTAPFESRSGSSFITHGFENALRRNQFELNN